MTWVVPRWVLTLLMGAGSLALIVGFATEETDWAAHRPFSVNLLSSLAGFAWSLTFASFVVNRMSRRQYWNAELDRRTRAAMTVDQALRRLARYLSLDSYRPVDAQLRELDRPSQDDGEAGVDDVVKTVPEAFDPLKADVLAAVGLEDRLSFLADGDLIYLTDRLARKWRLLEDVVLLTDGRAAADRTSDLVSSGLELCEALLALRGWVHQAPDRKMRAAVREQAFRSDLD